VFWTSVAERMACVDAAIATSARRAGPTSCSRATAGTRRDRAAATPGSGATARRRCRARAAGCATSSIRAAGRTERSASVRRASAPPDMPAGLRLGVWLRRPDVSEPVPRPARGRDGRRVRAPVRSTLRRTRPDSLRPRRDLRLVPSCDGADAFGACVNVGTPCDDNEACGCDGTTYPTRCALEAAGVARRNAGSCPAP
jgi:hypothetical protein